MRRKNQGTGTELAITPPLSRAVTATKTTNGNSTSMVPHQVMSAALYAALDPDDAGMRESLGIACPAHGLLDPGCRECYVVATNAITGLREYVSGTWKPSRAPTDWDQVFGNRQFRSAWQRYGDFQTVLTIMAGQELMRVLCSRFGMAVSHLSDLVNIPVPRLREIRLGKVEPSSPSENGRLQELAAWLFTVREQDVSDPARWLTTPLMSRYTVTPAHLYRADTARELLALVLGLVDAADVLDKLAPDWRERYHTDFRVTDMPDGERGIIYEPREPRFGHFQKSNTGSHVLVIPKNLDGTFAKGKGNE